MIFLYPHNQITYKALCDMLETHNRACIIQPCGTGKAMLGFHFAEMHPDDRILWLSPNDYIFSEQNDNLRRESDTAIHDNIEQMTYATAMNRAKNNTLEVTADYIILDEFHHCGAPEWSKGVAAIFEQCPNAKVIGLSATHIRYSDSGRNMADELFEGNIASQMTLEEAWLQGILPMPTYVTALYEAPKELDDIQARIENIKDKKKHGEFMKKYEQLRRSLAEADGLDEIFAKYITKPNAKLIVFCPNTEKLEDFSLLRRDWFKHINKDIHVYKTYIANPRGNKDYEGFKCDDTDALKVLYCIDQLNEGVHIDGIDAVIMVRPTTSPVVFTQQLGRALECGSNQTPLVFDLVNNLGSVGNYAISSDRIEDAYSSLSGEGKRPKYTPEDFQIYDEIQDPRELMSELKEALDPHMTIDEKIEFLEAIAAENGGRL